MKKFLLFVCLCLPLTAQAATTSLTWNQMFAMLMMPVAASDIVHNTAVVVVGTTPVEAVTADVATAKRSKNAIQVLVITNKHATQNLCFTNLDWSASDANCEVTCAAGGSTCTGTAATDGSWILPATQRAYTLFGDQCGCLVGSASSTSFSADRIVR